MEASEKLVISCPNEIIEMIKRINDEGVTVLLVEQNVTQTLKMCHRAYALENDLEWIDDPSNQDTGLDRNFLRHCIVPELRGRWPGLSARSLSRWSGRSEDCSSPE